MKGEEDMAAKKAALLEKRMRREREAREKKQQQELDQEQKKESARLDIILFCLLQVSRCLRLPLPRLNLFARLQIES